MAGLSLDEELELEREKARASQPAGKKAAFASAGSGTGGGGGGGFGAPEPNPFDQTYTAQGFSGINEGLANTLGAPVDIANMGYGLALKGINAVAGTDFQPSQEPLGGSAMFKRGMQNLPTGSAIREETDDPAKQFVRRTGQSVGASMVPALTAARTAAAPLQVAGGILGSGLTGGASAATAEQIFPDNPTAEMVAEVVGSLGPVAATAALKKHYATKAARASVPTTEKLEEQAVRLYKQAEQKGVTASQAQTTALRDSIRQTLTDEGLITPSGRVASSFPKITDALNNFDDYANGTMSVKQMRATRRLLRSAAKSADDSERRIGTILLKQFDDFVDPMAPQIKAANQLYHRASKAEDLETLRLLAESKAGQFTGSGYENALRSQYRGLEQKLIKGQVKGFTPAEQKAVTKVAQGTKASNTARNIGRMAPTGPVSMTTTMGVPYAIGHTIGGPPLGMALATGAAGASYGGRAAATRMGINAANEAELLARSGGSALPSGTVDMELLRRILLGSTVAPVTNATSR